MLNFVDPTEVKLPNPENRDATYSLNLCQSRLNTFLTTYKKEGKATPNLLVRRNNGLNLALKIANETAQLVPIEEGTTESIAEQIENVIRQLPIYKTPLHEFYLWVAENTGKKKDMRTPRPEIDWNVETGLEEAS